MTIVRAWLPFGVVLMVLTCASARVRADSLDAPVPGGSDRDAWNRGVAIADRDAARVLFLEGNRLFRVPLFARAVENYEQALARWSHPAFHFNMALALLNLGEDLKAHAILELALRAGPVPIGAERYEEGKKQLADLERRLGRIQIRCQLSGAEIALDGGALFVGPGRYVGWTEPKAHEITATRRDYLSEAKRVTVAAGQVQDIEIKLVTLDEAADAGRPWAKWKPWAVVAAGLVVAGGSAAVHAVSAHDFKRFDDDFVTLGCSTTGCTTAELGPSRVQRLSHGALLQDIAVGGYITGGVLFTAGVALLYFNRPRLVEQRVTTARTNHLDITPTVSGDAIGVVLTMDR